MKVDVTRVARIVVVCGGSGTGKSAWTKQQIARKRRLLVWDPDGEYATDGFCRPVAGKARLIEALAAAKNGPARITYLPRDLKDFDFWSRAALAWRNCTAVAEEIADVTSPGKAPPGWGQLVRRGRKYGVEVFAVTQRPAESDKTIIGNATLTHACRLKRARDRAYMAEEMGIDRVDLDALKPLEWVECDDRGAIRKGKMRF